jgi:hypothetical protein
MVDRVDAGAAVHCLVADLPNHNVVAAVAEIGGGVAVRDDGVAARAVLIDFDALQSRRAAVDGRTPDPRRDRAGLEVEHGRGIGGRGMVERIRPAAAVDIVVELARENADRVVAVAAIGMVGHEAGLEGIVPQTSEQALDGDFYVRGDEIVAVT